jgi:hypothetical protein
MEYDPLAAFTAWTKALQRMIDNPDAPEDALKLVLKQMHFWAGRLAPEIKQYRAELKRLALQ